MDPLSLKILQSVLVGLNVYEAAEPYLNKIESMNAAGATGEDILAATETMRKQSGGKLDEKLAKT